MVNQSKSSDTRAWKRWHDAGAVGTITNAYLNSSPPEHYDYNYYRMSNGYLPVIRKIPFRGNRVLVLTGRGYRPATDIPGFIKSDSDQRPEVVPLKRPERDDFEKILRESCHINPPFFFYLPGVVGIELRD